MKRKSVTKPIRSEAEYDRVLAEIAALLDAPPQSAAADRLELLSILAEAWESAHHPIDPPDPIDAIRHFGRQQKLFFAHFRAVQGQLPGVFHEVFMDEGDWDMVAAVKAYQEVGFEGPIRADHTPWIVEDNEWAHRGFAFEIGYMRGLVQALDELG